MGLKFFFEVWKQSLKVGPNAVNFAIAEMIDQLFTLWPHPRAYKCTRGRFNQPMTQYHCVDLARGFLVVLVVFCPSDSNCADCNDAIPENTI